MAVGLGKIAQHATACRIQLFPAHAIHDLHLVRASGDRPEKPIAPCARFLVISDLSRPELVVHFFREIVGVAEVSKEALSQRTADYQNWVEAYARNHAIPIEWAENGVRKEDHVLPWLRRMEKRNAYGVYFIFKSMEQGPTFRISLPKYPAKDPHYRIVAH